MSESAQPTLDSEPPASAPTLARTMTLWGLVVFGVGDMVGAGIYGTIGKTAGLMGNAVWMAFAASMLAALLTGLSYASIASRYPRAAGAPYVVQRSFGLPLLSYIVGLAVCASGLTSMAAGGNVFAENIQKFLDVRKELILVPYFAALTFINFWGIRESLWMNILCTFIEVGGLIFVLLVGIRFWGAVDYMQTATGPAALDGATIGLVMSGAVLAFFAFIGFEDMLNLCEEVKNPRRNVPWGMMIAIVIVAILYVSISITAVSVVPSNQLADTRQYGAPLTQITNRAAPWLPGGIYTFITLFAVANTGLINYIMGSRLMYGMSRQGLLPRALGNVHRTRRTPHIAIFTLAVIVLILAFSGGVAQLASATSLLLLNCFVLLNAALIVLQRRPGEPKGQFEVWTIVPVLGVLICGGLIVGRLVTAYVEKTLTGDLLTTAIIFAGIVVMYWIVRPKAIPETQDLGAELP
jgi:amino acid transporter